MWIWGLPFALLASIAVPTTPARAGTTVCISAGDSFTAEKTEALLRKRFSDIHLELATPYASYEPNRSMLVPSTDKHLVQTLIARGRIGLRFLPRGPEYRSAKPFASAAVSYDNSGNRIISFTLADSSAFYGFTRRNVGKSLGISVDGHLVTAPYVQAPIGRDGEVALPRDASRPDVLAALMDSGSISERAAVSLGKPGSSCN